MNQESKQESKKELKPHFSQDDFYWTFFDADDDYEGYLHLVCTYDGSTIKIPVEDLLTELGSLLSKGRRQPTHPNQ